MEASTAPTMEASAARSAIVKLELSVLSATSLRCSVILGDEPFRASIESARAACAAASTASCPLTVRVVGTVLRKPRSMGGITFVDLGGADQALENNRLQVVVHESDLHAGLRGLALPVLLRRLSVIAIDGTPGRSQTGEPSLFARALQLHALPADPPCLLKVAQIVASCADLPAEDAAASLGCDLDELYSLVHALEAEEESATAEVSAATMRLARVLSTTLRSRRDVRRGAGRERPPRFSSAEFELMRSVGRCHATCPADRIEELAPLDDVQRALSGPLAPERGLPDGLSPADYAVRLRYLHEKKLPQLRWMLHQVRAHCATSHALPHPSKATYALLRLFTQRTDACLRCAGCSVAHAPRARHRGR